MKQYSQNSIYIRAQQRASTKFDIDQNKAIYTLIDKLNDLSIVVASPEIYTVSNLKFLLLYDSSLKKLDDKYYQRPDLLSYDEYGTEQLDWILMFVNDVFCYEEFTLAEVFIPTIASIAKITEFQLPKKLRNIEVELT